MGSSNFIAIDCPWQPKWIKLGFEFAKLLFEPLQTSLARLLLDMVGSIANCIGMGSGLENFLNTLFFSSSNSATDCSLASDYIFELENGPGEIVVDSRSFNRIGVDIPFLCFSFIYFPTSYGKLVQFKVKVPNIVLVLYNEFHFGNLNLFVIW